MADKYPNSGAIFKNDKEGNEARPDYTGNADIDNVAYWISAWIKDGQKGKFLSLSFKPKDVPAENNTPTDDDDFF